MICSPTEEPGGERDVERHPGDSWEGISTGEYYTAAYKNRTELSESPYNNLPIRSMIAIWDEMIDFGGESTN